MPYYPKSQISSNLYTNGNDLYLLPTGEPYTGYYYEISTGEKFTGKTPNYGENIPLTDIPTINPTTENYEGEFPQIIQSSYVRNYNNSPITPRSLPTPYYSQPTIVDRNNGEYQRYFAKKTNELIYIEISIETYLNFSNGDPKFATDLYEVISLPWSLGGDSESTNRNIVALIEKNNKWYGFSKYFKDNFTS